VPASTLTEWVLIICKLARVEQLFKKCCITNALDNMVDDLDCLHLKNESEESVDCDTENGLKSKNTFNK
jgi:hypothetical protein